MRSDMEQQLNLIATGKATHNDVLAYYLKMFEQKFAFFTKHVKKKKKNSYFLYLFVSKKTLNLNSRLNRWMNSLKPHSPLWLQLVNPFQNVENVKGI
jgi:DNA topoisomerase-3